MQFNWLYIYRMQFVHDDIDDIGQCVVTLDTVTSFYFILDVIYISTVHTWQSVTYVILICQSLYRGEWLTDKKIMADIRSNEPEL